MTEPKLARNWKYYQRSLFPDFEEPEDAATESIQRLYHVLDTLQMGKYFRPQGCDGGGRPKKDRLAMLRSFVAKVVLNIPTTKALIERIKTDPPLRRICQWESKRDVPCEATFSNAFAEFAESELLTLIHSELIIESYKDKLVGHVARDATAIESREKPAKRPKIADEMDSKLKKKRGRPKTGEERPAAEEKRIEKQMHTPLAQSLAELPKQCDRGAKTNAKGYQETWNGYKLHLDVTEHGVPVSCILTSASLHDSQVAIPLETMTANRITHCYSLMDKGYCSDSISFYAESLGKVAIIDPKKPRGAELVPLDPAKKERYKIRTVVERTNSQLKDSAGGRCVRVKGHLKVMTHLMFGVLVITAEQLMRHVL